MLGTAAKLLVDAHSDNRGAPQKTAKASRVYGTTGKLVLLGAASNHIEDCPLAEGNPNRHCRACCGICYVAAMLSVNATNSVEL